MRRSYEQIIELAEVYETTINIAVHGYFWPLRGQPAVNGECVAGDPGRIVAAEERHGVGDVLGLAEAERMSGLDRV